MCKQKVKLKKQRISGVRVLSLMSWQLMMVGYVQSRTGMPSALLRLLIKNNVIFHEYQTS